MRRWLAGAFVALAALAGTLALAIPGSGRTKPAETTFRASPYRPVVGRTFTLTATVSKCKKCRYRWEVVVRRRGGGRTLRKMGTGRVLRYRFHTTGIKTIRMTATDRKGKRIVRSKRVKVVTRAAAGSPGGTGSGSSGSGGAGSPASGTSGSGSSTTLPAAQPDCATGAVTATNAGQVRSSLASGRDVCVTAAVGDVDLSDIRLSAMHSVGTRGSGSLGTVTLMGSAQITLRARMRAITIGASNTIVVERSVIGGTSSARVSDQLVFIPETSDDVSIRDNDIGWTTADNSGNTGYGIRAFGSSARLRIERNLIHNIGADGIQLGMDGPDTLVDRNEIAYVAPPPSSSEHSDDIQVVSNGPNLQITNNYMHDNGYLTAGGAQSGGSGPYIHAGTTNSLRFENNLVRDEANFMQVGNLGTGGCSRSNLTFRRNTFTHNGRLFTSPPDLYWRLCGGANNVFERNVVNRTFWNESGFGASGTVARDNLIGAAYTINATGACTVAACNPSGQEAIGYRKPSGVHW